MQCVTNTYRDTLYKCNPMRKFLLAAIFLAVFTGVVIRLSSSPVLVWGFNHVDSSDFAIKGFSFEKDSDLPKLRAEVENQGPKPADLAARLVLYDEVNNIAKDIPLPKVSLPAVQTSEVELTWEQPWQGWGIILAELSLQAPSGETAAASTRFIYLPPEMATLSLATLLAMGGFIGRNLMARIILS